MKLFCKILMTTALLCVSSWQVFAATITREDVEKHLQKMVDHYNVYPVDMNAIYEFMKASSAKDGIYSANLFINGNKIPVSKSQSTEQVLASVKSFNDRYLKASARYEMAEFKPVEDDATKVQVKYKIWHDATLEHIISPKEIGQVSFKSVADCIEIFSLEDTQVMSHKNACEIQMTQEQPTIRKTDEAESKTP